MRLFAFFAINEVKAIRQAQEGYMKDRLSVVLRFRYALLFAFGILLYSNSIPNRYNLDDELVTKNHPLTSQGIKAIPTIFSQPYYSDASGYKYEYRPIALVSFAVEHSLFGESPHISHAVNVLLYGLLCVLLLLLLEIFITNKWIALAAALMFVVHPVHTEVVNSIKNRDEILMALFGLSSLVITVKFLQQSKAYNYLLVLLVVALTMLSKVSGIVFPAAIPLIAVLYDRHVTLKKYFLLLAPALTVIVIFSLLYNTSFLLWMPLLAVVGYIAAYAIRRLRGENIMPHLNQSISEFLKWGYHQFSKILNYDFSSDTHQVKPVLLVLLLLAGAISGICGFFLLSIICLLLSVFTIVFTNPDSLTPLQLLLLGMQLSLYRVLFFQPQLEIQPHLWLSIASAGYFLVNPSTSRTLYILIIGTGVSVFDFCLRMLFSYPHMDIDVMSMIFKGQIVLFEQLPFFLLFTVIRLPFIAIMLLISLSQFINKQLSPLLIYGSILLVHFRFLSYRSFMRLSILLLLAAIVEYQSYGSKYFFLPAYQISYILSGSNAPFPPPEFDTRPLAASGNKQNEVFNRPLEFVEYPLVNETRVICHIGTSMQVLGKYLQLVTVAYPLSFYYGYRAIDPDCMASVSSWIIVFLHLLLLAIALYFRKKIPLLSAGILIYLSTIMLYSGMLIKVAGLVAERYLLVPSIGYCIALSSLLGLKGAAKWMRYIWGFIVVAYAILTFSRNFQWDNHLTLMLHDIKHLHNSAQANNLLASNLMIYSFEEPNPAMSLRMKREAVTYYRRALEIYPDFFNAWYDLGKAYLTLNDPNNAMQCFIKVYQMDSTFSRAALQIAMIAQQKGDYNTAIRYYQSVIKNDPYMAEAYAGLGLLYFNLKDYHRSIEVSKLALQQNPQWKEFNGNIANAYLMLGDTLQAQEYFNKLR
ncbi:MAG: hypothetical protein KatS3mg031_0123 [Chitinophagales bacterium]|nr:MAG: hypothetical protein KatS3mg031_0123 [Chitinophagales bacterium]